MNSTLDWNTAVDIVRHFLFESRCVTLTDEEGRLVREYGEADPKPDHATLDPNVRLLWSPPRPRSSVPPGAQMADRIGLAVDRNNQMVRQIYAARDWLVHHGFNNDVIDRIQLQAKMADHQLGSEVIKSILKEKADAPKPARRTNADRMDEAKRTADEVAEPYRTHGEPLPNASKHTTLVMALLKQRTPHDRAKQEEIYNMISNDPGFAKGRLLPGYKRSRKPKLS